MMKPPKEISKAKIPRKTIIISYAVIYATSLPMYSLAREATTLSWALSYLKVYHNHNSLSIFNHLEVFTF